MTDRGVVVAELTEPGEGVEASPYPRLLGPAREGRVRLGAANSPDLYAPLDPLLEPGDALRLLDAERGDS